MEGQPKEGGEGDRTSWVGEVEERSLSTSWGIGEPLGVPASYAGLSSPADATTITQ